MTVLSPPITRNVADRAATTALFLANGFAAGTWAGGLPRLQDAKHLSAGDLGVVLFVLSVGAVIAMPLAGWIAGRVGPARLAALVGLCQAAALTLPALTPSWALLLASAALLGLAMGGMDVAMNGHASAVERAWGASIMSSFHAGWSCGGLAGASLAGALAARGVALPAAYAWPAVAVAALAAPALLIRDTGPREAGGHFELPSRAMLAVTLLAGLCFLAEAAMADWAGVYLHAALGADLARAASVYGFFAVAMATGRLPGDATIRRFGPVRVVRGGGALATLGMALMLAAPAAWLVDVALVLIGLGLANIVPAVFSAAGRMRGTAGVAMAATVGYAGFMTGPPIIGGAAQLAGLGNALLLVLACCAALAWLGRAVTPVTYSAPRSPPSPPPAPVASAPRRVRSRRRRRPARDL